MIAELLTERGIADAVAQLSVQSFLFNFRLCPANPEMGLHEWRHLLWSQALGTEYSYLASEIHEKWLNLRWQQLAISTEVASMLIRLRRRFLVGLITNGPSNAQWEKVQQLNLAHYFDVVVVSGDLPWEKPDIRIFQQACNTLGVRPSDCLMIGDKLETDVVGGIEARFGATVWVPLSTHKVDMFCRPDFILKNVLELPSLLSKDSERPAIMKNRSGSLSVTNRNLLRVCNAELDDTNSNASDGS